MIVATLKRGVRIAALGVGLFLIGLASAQAAPGPDAARAPDSAATVATPSPRDYVAEARANFTPENRAYSAKRTVLSFVAPIYALLTALLVLFSGLSAKLRDLADRLSRRFYLRVLAFLTLYSLVDFALGFPLNWYEGFALEHQYRLSTQSFMSWLGEQGKSGLVGIVCFGLVPVLWLAYGAIRRWPRGWWLAMALGTLPLIVAGTLVQPLVIDPLYNRFTPLRDQHLKARILDLAERAGIPGRKVYEVDRSAQTRTYNAYVSGFGASQRIVLWDTTLEGMREDEILFVVGHEMGHYRLGHIWGGICAFSLLSFLLFFLAARLCAWALARFGPGWGIRELTDIATLPLLIAVIGLLLFLAQPLIDGHSRRIEHEADAFAVELTRDNDAGARAFLKLGSQNRSNPEPSAFIAWFEYSHPPLMDRIRFALSYRPWERGEPNRYFHGAEAHPSE